MVIVDVAVNVFNVVVSDIVTLTLRLPNPRPRLSLVKIFELKKKKKKLLSCLFVISQ